METCLIAISCVVVSLLSQSGLSTSSRFGVTTLSIITSFDRTTDRSEISATRMYPLAHFNAFYTLINGLICRTLPVICLIVVSTRVLEVVASNSLPEVTCGSSFKLINANFLTKLHSHDIKYGSGSGQQSVTATDDNEDADSYWQVRGAHGEPACTRGQPIQCGSNIRLVHLTTGKHLHSHLFSSPISGQQEVSAFGKGGGDGDTGDNWTVHCSSSPNWLRSDDVRFKHVDTEKWLAVSGRTYGRPISGHMEVVGAKFNDASSHWRVGDGVFIKPDPDNLLPSPHDEL